MRIYIKLAKYLLHEVIKMLYELKNLFQFSLVGLDGKISSFNNTFSIHISQTYDYDENMLD